MADGLHDIVRYGYEWLVDGEALRSVTSAGQADAIPHHTILAGEVLECRVTPSDGINRGDTVSTLCGDLDSTCIRVAINVASSIKTDKRGVVPVVVFGSEALDVADLDVDSLRFGPDGAATAHDLTGLFTWNEQLQDVNLDGFMDVMTHYRVDESGIAPGDESADLLGLTLGRRPLKGSGSIETVSRGSAAPQCHRRASDREWPWDARGKDFRLSVSRQGFDFVTCLSRNARVRVPLGASAAHDPQGLRCVKARGRKTSCLCCGAVDAARAGGDVVRSGSARRHGPRSPACDLEPPGEN